MSSKRSYTSEADKGNFLGYIDDGEDIMPAAKKAKISIKTARGIKKRDDENTSYCDHNNISTLSLHDRTIIQPKSGRHQVLTELNIEQLDNAITQDRRHREMPEFDVS
jgi:hypothetical protein